MYFFTGKNAYSLYIIPINYIFFLALFRGFPRQKYSPSFNVKKNKNRIQIQHFSGAFYFGIPIVGLGFGLGVGFCLGLRFRVRFRVKLGLGFYVTNSDRKVRAYVTNSDRRVRDRVIFTNHIPVIDEGLRN